MKTSVHDQYVNELSERLSGSYDTISHNVVIQNKKRRLAEVDLLCKSGELYDVFEVKVSYRPVKARRQAAKIRKHLSLPIRDFFLYCGASGQVVKLN